MSGESKISVVLVLCFLLFFMWLMSDFWQNHAACEKAGGTYLRSLLVWNCVDGTPVPYKME